MLVELPGIGTFQVSEIVGLGPVTVEVKDSPENRLANPNDPPIPDRIGFVVYLKTAAFPADDFATKEQAEQCRTAILDKMENHAKANA